MGVSLSSIQKSAERIAPYIENTPLIRCFALEKYFGLKTKVFLKCEHLQWTHSFKVRGAFNALLMLSEEEKKRGVITRSAGNFAQAVARAAKILGIQATIVMPEDVPLVKKEGVLHYGARAILHGITSSQSLSKVKEIQAKEGQVLLSPYDHLGVIQGQGTMALEIFLDLPSIKTFVGQIGGGGLLGGASVAFKELNPNIQIVGVEPEGASDYYLSRERGKRVELEDVKTIADGLKASQVGDLNFPLLQKYVDEVYTVSEDSIKKALHFVYNRVGIMAEPSGVCGLALLFEESGFEAKGDTVFVLSGSNVDPDKFYEWVRGPYF